MEPNKSPSLSIESFHSQPSQDVQMSSTYPTSAEPTSATQSRPATSGGDAPGRKRKVPGSVTPNACTTCKRARAKCDGGKPACSRCVSRGVNEQCHYELHAKTAKEQMIREIQRLQRKNEHLEEENDTLGERNTWIEQIMGSLRDDGNSAEIITRLKRGESHESIATWLGRPLVGGAPNLSPTTERSVSLAIEQYHRDLVNNHGPRYWTNVSTDVVLIEHLIQLYLTWIHPVHMLFDGRHFMSSFRNCLDTHCSSTLVNIICAMSCHLLHNTWADDVETQAAIDSLRSQFLEESRSLMRDADPGKMTSIQTYAIMFLVEMGSGHGLSASSHLRLATESLIAKQTTEQLSESEEVAAWGILTLHIAWSAFTFQQPSAHISTPTETFEYRALHDKSDVWRLYRKPGDTIEDYPERRGYSLMTAAENVKLFRINHETILVYCGSRGRVKAHALLELYDRYLVWKECLPPDIRNVEEDTLPHVLILHITYRTSLVNLLEPLLHLDYYDRQSYNDLRNLIVSHAKLGLDLLIEYRKLYSNYYLAPLQLFCLVHLCDALVCHDNDERTTSDVVHFCFNSLEEAKLGYPVAGALQKMFRVALTESSIPVPNDLERLIGPAVRLGPEDLLDACTRVTYRQPISQILHNLEPGLGQKFMDEWHRRSPQLPEQGQPLQRPHADSSSSGKQKNMDIGSLLNK